MYKLFLDVIVKKIAATGKSDIIYALLAFLAGMLIVGFLNMLFPSKACANEFYADLGFGFTKDVNVFCLDPHVDKTYGIINLGWQMTDHVSAEYHHNSCVFLEDNEGSLDSAQIIYRFKPKF